MLAAPDPSVQYLFYVHGAYQKTHSGVGDYYCYDDSSALKANGFTVIGEIRGWNNPRECGARIAQRETRQPLGFLLGQWAARRGR